MIEITERQAVAIGAAVKVINALDLEKGNPIEWIRGILPENESDAVWIKVYFWIAGNPSNQKVVVINVVRTQAHWIPALASVYGMREFQPVDHLFSFNINGDPLQIN